MNQQKTKIKRNSLGILNINLEGKLLERVKEYTYLGQELQQKKTYSTK